MMPPTPAQAYWNQRHTLARDRERILMLAQAVDRPIDLVPHQWAQFMAYVLEFQPNLIVELGRGQGNSTCAFTEAANLLGPSRCRVLSLCLSDSWEKETLPRVQQVVPASWFHCLRALRGDILTFDFKSSLAGAGRVLLFWDAHGFDVADTVLSRILPEIADRPHAVLLHDMADGRHSGVRDRYDDDCLWKGESSCGSEVRLGHIASHVAQAVAAVDFTSRNKITLDSADRTFVVELVQDEAKNRELRDVLGDQLYATWANWFWFSLNERPGPYTFPRHDPQSRSYEYRFEQQQPELHRLRREAAEVRQLADELRQKLEHIQQEYERTCRGYLDSEASHNDLHNKHRQLIADLSEARTALENRVKELSRSRWRRLGRKLGLAKKSSWE